MKNWKTTLAGAVGAALTLLIAQLSTGTISLKDAGIAAALAFVGFLAKDFDTTGIGGTATK